MLELGSIIDNKYRILDVVGSGGMSTVYLVRNEKANKSWAIKEVLKQGQEDLEIKKNSLIAETEMLKKLDHPNLPSIIDVIETEDTYLVVMDYIEGNDLGEVLNEFGAQSQEKVIEWAKQVCDVLSYLHSRSPVIIYRDLKPANIMLKPDGNITLIDFGTAREAEIKDVANTISLGTRGYAAPEQFGDGARADARTDIYCFGATIYHLVTGHSPAEEPYIIEPIRQINPSLSGGLEKIILKCTQSDPSKRYQNCEELAYDLEHYQEIDDLYKKKQKKKLYLFVTSFVLSIVCFAVAAFGYIQNSNQIIQKYSELIESGKYVDAIKLDNTNPEAYSELLKQYTKDGLIDDSNITEGLSIFESYEDTSNNGEIIYPMYDLAKTSIKDYIDICYATASGYWECYKTPSARSSKAAPWFKRILPSDYKEINYKDFSDGKIYTISLAGKDYSVTVGENGDITLREFQVALVCVQINDCKDNIEIYTNSNASINSLSGEDDLKNSYILLWDNLQNLYLIVNNIDDSQLSIILCNEIFTELNEYFKNIISYNSITQNELVNDFINPIKKMIDDIVPNSDIVSSNKGKLVQVITETNNKINQYYENGGGQNE